LDEVRNRNGGQHAEERHDDHDFDGGEAFVIVQMTGLLNQGFDLPPAGPAIRHCASKQDESSP
jgi:hypothetical protein